MGSQIFDDEQIASFCLDKLGAKPDCIERPGGASRKTVLVEVNGQRLAVSKRNSIGRAKLEADILSKFGNTEAVPRLVLQSDRFVVQHFVAGQRLPEVLETSPETARNKQLVAAGKSLLFLQKTGQENGLIGQVPMIGARPNWHEDFASAPTRLAGQLGLEPAMFNRADIIDKIRPKAPSFVKWDSRPGNCLWTNDGGVVWFDWEHCGIGSTEDDLVWLLADEWAPISLSAEQSLLQNALENGTLSLDELTFRFRAKAILHTSIRLGLIFNHKGEGSWWNARHAMQLDHIGVTLPHVRRLCRRARLWALASPEFGDLSHFFDNVHEYAELLPNPS